MKDGREHFEVVQWDDEPELKTQIKRSRLENNNNYYKKYYLN